MKDWRNSQLIKTLGVMEVAKRMKITPGALSNKLNGNCRNRITPTDDISLKIIEDEFKKSLLKAFEDED